jgi:tight adherence protein C
MVSAIYAKISDPAFLLMILVAVASAATVLTVAMPFLEGDRLKARMKAVSTERERIRQRERERLNAEEAQKRGLRQAPKGYMKDLVAQLDLKKYLGTDTAKSKLMMAGFRGQQSEVSFLFFRFVLPIGFFLISLFYIFFVIKLEQPPVMKLGIAVGFAFLGMKLPELYLSNIIQKRQQSIQRAFPDALDLTLICVESGMSIEQTFRRVSQEVGTQSIPLAEELTLATAELSYLPDRRQAFENLGNRTGLDSVRSVCTALVQAERYGTPLGSALRVLAQEMRDQRMNAAEKKAAALPPKLTVPMILFFLPVLFVVIMTPAMIQVFEWK